MEIFPEGVENCASFLPFALSHQSELLSEPNWFLHLRLFFRLILSERKTQIEYWNSLKSPSCQTVLHLSLNSDDLTSIGTSVFSDKSGLSYSKKTPSVGGSFSQGVKQNLSAESVT